MTTPAAPPRRPSLLPCQRQTRPAPYRAAAALAALLAAALCGTAAAQVSPYYVGVSQTLAYNSNVRRLGEGERLLVADNVHKSDLISSTALVAGIDQSFGRQRVYGSGRLGLDRYQHNTTLNGQTYNLNLGLDWATVERLSGTVSVGAAQNLAQFNAGIRNGTLLTAPNVSNTEQLNARVALGMVTRYTAEASLGWRRQRYSATEYQVYAFDETNGSVGLRYRPSDLLALGAALRLTQASYPRFNEPTPGVFVADTLQREDIDFTAQWQPSGASTINARLSPTHTRYDRATATNFSGLTGSAAWTWAATGKTQLAATLSRDTSQSAQATTLIAGSQVSDFGQMTTALQLRADHALTGKINLNSSLSYASRALTSNTVNPLQPNTVGRASDKGATLALGARWAPTRGSLVGCDISHEQRNSSNKALLPTYSVSLFSCYGQLTLQSL